MKVENKIISDSSWYNRIKSQAKEKEISEGANLWENAKYTWWLKYDSYFEKFNEGQKWVNMLYYKNEILKKSDWVMNIKEVSKRQKIEFESLLMENVKFLAYTNRGKFKVELNVDQVGQLIQEINIRNDEKWKRTVQEDAKKKGIGFEECLRGHASFVYFENKKESE